MPVLANMLVSSGVRLKSESPLPPFSLGVAAATATAAAAAAALERAQAKQHSHSVTAAPVEEDDACADSERHGKTYIRRSG